MRILPLLLFFFAAPALAEVRTKVLSDLNGNTAPETFELLVDEDNTVTLRVTEDGSDPIEARDIVWQGGLFGQEAELDLAPDGSVRVISQNEGCCRHRWRQTLTLVFDTAAIRVAEVTYTWRDTLDLDAHGTCSVNLLNGKGFNTLGEGSPEWFTVPALAPDITEWSVDTPLPDACKIG